MMRQLLIISGMILLLFSVSSCVTVDVGSMFDSELTETVISSDKGAKDKVLIVDVGGFIKNGEDRGMFSGKSCTPSGIKKILNRAEHDKSIKAVILRVNSPGGGVTASDLIYHEVKRFKQRTGLPVYVSTLTLAASGGYYIAAAADEIYASPTSLIGSIGVIARFPDFSKLADKLGYNERIFQSGPNKASGHPLRKLTAEQEMIFQKMIDDMYGRFLEVVSGSRKQLSNLDKLRPIADGRIYTAKEAQKHGLIDGVLYLDEVVDKIKRDNRLSRTKLVMYSYGSSSDTNIYSRFNPEINILNLDIENILGPLEPGLHYLWLPVK